MTHRYKNWRLAKASTGEKRAKAVFRRCPRAQHALHAHERRTRTTPDTTKSKMELMLFFFVVDLT
ncbi:hypothetical protein JYU34_005068 [Plutella xylostella]|uniref:Uncharacterized protein n=1 Tax=Plutella xylostella TaxID=51655 RepID=A0ABQ7QVT1_PLUXY|nr:hypothetical protein JYU34_005068 [Plutella xylostella]